MRTDIVRCLILCAAAACTGCGSVRVTPGQATRGISPIATDAPEENVPDAGDYTAVTECPVCGRPVTVEKNTPAAQCGGQMYYFCCPSCRGQFRGPVGK